MSAKKRPVRPKVPTKFRGLIDWVWASEKWNPRARIRRSGINWSGAMRATVEEAARDAFEVLKDGAAPAAPKPPAAPEAAPVEGMLLGDAFTEVIELAESRGARPKSLQALEQTATAIFRHFREDVPVASIKATDLQWYIRKAKEAGRHKHSIAEKDVPLLRRAFMIAGLVFPDGVRVPRVVRNSVNFLEPAMLTEIVHRMRYEEFKDKKDTVRDLSGRQRDADFVELLICTGLRLGELGRLRTSDCTPTSVTATNNKDAGRRRYIPVPERVRPALARLIEGADADGYIHREAMDRLSKTFGKWSARLGVRLSGRLLRHSYITGMLYAGADIVTVRDLAGHRTLETTNIYAHAISTARDEASDAFDRLLSGTMHDGAPSDEPKEAPNDAG